jgi:hypothetical protein
MFSSSQLGEPCTSQHSKVSSSQLTKLCGTRLSRLSSMELCRLCSSQHDIDLTPYQQMERLQGMVLSPELTKIDATRLLEDLTT